MKITFEPEQKPSGLQNFCSFTRFNQVMSLHGISYKVEDFRTFDWAAHESFIKDACALKDWESLAGIHLSHDGINIIIDYAK